MSERQRESPIGTLQPAKTTGSAEGLFARRWPVTVTVIVTSGILRPLACRIVVPAPTDVHKPGLDSRLHRNDMILLLRTPSGAVR